MEKGFQLDANCIITTIESLHDRIEQRFPGSGLSNLCRKLCHVAKNNHIRAEDISRPNYYLRVLVGLIILTSIAVLFYGISNMDLTVSTVDAAELVQIAEAGMNDVIIIGAAIFFLITFETKIKRNKALQALEELRSISHVIDMHQLTKDPSRFGKGVIATPASPKASMTPYELLRYLDYCSEMLSITSKVAALFAQSYRDEVVLSTVNEIEALTTGLSRKIWQKIMILNMKEDAAQGLTS